MNADPRVPLPVAAPDPRVEPRGYQRDGFEVTFWTYYEPTSFVLSPVGYADALAHVPTPVGERYPNVDPALFSDCRQLVLAMVATWRSDREDQFPSGPTFGRELLNALRAGPPWPTIDEAFDRG